MIEEERQRAERQADVGQYDLAGTTGSPTGFPRAATLGLVNTASNDEHRRYMRQEALMVVVRAMQCGSTVADLREAIQTVEAFTAGSTLRTE